MTSIPIRNMYWQNSVNIPNTLWNICGYSRSALRTGFYIKELKIMLDAGPQCLNKPSHIFITHTHMDHVANLPLTLLETVDYEDKENVCQIYGPKNCDKYMNDYITSMFALNRMEEIDTTLLSFYKIIGLDKRDNFNITTNNVKLNIEVFECDHSIPTISYGFSEIKSKLKDKYIGLDGKNIKQLKSEGIEITEQKKYKKFAYICDTSINVFELNPTILEYDVIFIECTFLMENELENAIKTKHIHWIQLKPYIERYSEKTFILFHFSQRYKNTEIAEFFKLVIESGIKNIKVWINDFE